MKNQNNEQDKKVLVEVCCGSAEDAIQAAEGGAERAELCSNMFQGGLTPTPGMFETVRNHSDIAISVMIRPREGGFCYTDSEFETALIDQKYFIEAGADALVCGFLKPNGEVDVEKTKQFVDAAGDIPVTFHRAFDVVPDWKKAMDQLVECGVTRILTSGQAPSVEFALPTIKEMVEYAGDRIIIMPGAGIRDAIRAEELVNYTGCKEIHVRLTKTLYDNSTENNTSIFYGSALYPPEDRYPVIDAAQVATLNDIK